MSTSDKRTPAVDVPGELLVVWQNYKASDSEEINLQEGDVVELIDTIDPAGPSIKRRKLNPELDIEGEKPLDTTAAQHRLAVRPRRTHTSSRHSPTRTNLNARWLVRKVQGDKRQGWVPCQILQSIDEPIPSSGLPGDAAFRRQAVVNELVETEQEFVKDLDYVVQNYLIYPEKDPKKVPKVVRDNFSDVFICLKEIAEFHRVVLMEGVKYYANEPALLGKAFLRLERDFDKHVNYCKEEPIAQAILEASDQARDYFEELSHRLGDDKTLAEHLKLPIQRINDYQLLIKELVRYSACLGEDNTDLQKALELMLSVPHRAQDDKFTSSIEGYRGSIHKLGRLLAHDWFSVNFGELVKERYLFLFKARILICKVRRISEDRSVFQLKDIIRLPQVDVKDRIGDENTFELKEKLTGQVLILSAHRPNVKQFWLKEIREFAGEADESISDDLQVTSEPTSPPTEPAHFEEKEKLPFQIEKKPRPQETKGEEPPVKVAKVEEAVPKVKEPLETVKPEVKKPEPKVVSKVEEPPARVEIKVEEPPPKPVTKVEEPPPKVVPKVEEPPPKVVTKVEELPPAKVVAKVEEPPAKVRKIEEVPPAKSEAVTKVEEAPKEVTEKLSVPRGETKPKPEESKPKSEESKLKPEEPKPKSEESKLKSEEPKPKSEASKPIQVKEESPKKSNPLIQATPKKVEDKPIANPKPAEDPNPGNPKVEVSKASQEVAVKSESSSTFVVQQTQSATVQKQSVSQVSIVSKEQKVITASQADDVERYKIGIQVGLKTEGLDIDDDMSRRYTEYTSSASARSGGHEDSSYSRRSGSKSSYSTEGYGSSKYEAVGSRRSAESALSSKYGADSLTSKYASESSTLSSKYGTDSGLTSKYGADAALTSKYSTDSALTSRYGADTTLSSKYGADTALTSKYSSDTLTSKYGNDSLGNKYGIESTKYGTEGNTKYEITSRYSKSDIDGGSKTEMSVTKRAVTDMGDGGMDAYGTYTRRSIRTEARLEDDGDFDYKRNKSKKAITDVGDSDSYSSYSRRSIRESKTIEDNGDYDSRASRRLRSKPSDDVDEYSYRKTVRSAERSTVGDGDGDYSYRKTIRSSERTGGDDEIGYSYKKKHAAIEDDSADTYISRRRSKKVEDEDDDDIDKYVMEQKSLDEDLDPTAYLSKRRSLKSEESEDSLTQTRKTIRQNSDKGDYKRLTSLEEEDKSSKYDRSSYKRTIALEDEEKSQKSERESSREYKSEISAEEEEKSVRSERYSKVSETREASSVKESSVDETDIEFVKTVAETAHMEDSIGLSMKAKKDITSPPDERPLFTKTLSGQTVEPGRKVFLEIVLAETPDNVIWLRNNETIPEKDLKRYIFTSREDHRIWRMEIKNTIESDSGLYTAVATNAKGKSTCSTRLFVNQPTTEELNKPHFAVQLKDTELLEDTYLRFMIKVRGDPHPDITFYKNGVKIPETDQRTRIIKDHENVGFYELVIPDVKPSDAGVYKCVAVNSYGEASSEAKLTVTGSKVVFDELTEKEGILPPGERPDFTWKKDGKEFDPEERFKVLMGDDEDSLALIFQHVRPEDAGLYTCVAQTSTGHISCSAELTVQGTVVELHREPQKPQLIIEHREANATIGGQAMLELQVKGYPKPKVKLTKEGRQIEASNKYKFLYEDEENLSVVIKNVEASDAGKYEFSAENELGQDIREMTLNVKAPPKIKTKLEDVSINIEQTLKLSVQVEGIPKPNVEFYKDGKVIKPSDRTKIIEEGDSLTLIIEKTTLKDSGSYSVVASNEIAQVSQFCNVNVYTKPRILKKLGDEIIVSKSENVELSVKLESEPAPEITWFKDGKEITSDSHYVIKQDGDSYILKITGAVTTDSSSYKCRAKNIHGSVDDDVRVNVRCAPRIIKPLIDMTVTEYDKNVTLDVKVEAFPKPNVKWYLDEMEISETRKEFTRIESDDGVKLVIKEVTSELSGQYSCKLNNELGGTETSAKLTVNCKPRIIKHLKDTTVEEGATLHLEVEVEGTPEPTVKWLRNGNEVSADARIKISRDIHRQESYNLTVNLIKYEEEGEYEVEVTNSLGTVHSKSYVTVQKTIHTDAIEETEEPPKKIIVEVLEDESDVAVEEEGVKIEEIIEEAPPDQGKKDLLVEDIDVDRKTGALASKEEVEIVESKIDKNELSSFEEAPVKNKRGKSIQIEESIITVEVEGQPSKAEEKVGSKRKPSKGKVLEIQEIEVVESSTEAQSPSEMQVEKKLKRAVSASKEEAIEDEFKPSKRKQSQVETLDEESSKQAVVATKAEIVEEEPSQRRESKVEIIEKVKIRKAIVATKDEIVEVENEVVSSKRKESKVEIVEDKTKTAIMASKEDVVPVENEAVLKRQQSKVESVDESAQKAISATKEGGVEVEQDLHKLSRRESRIETTEKDAPQKAKESKVEISEEKPEKAIVASKEDAVPVENEAVLKRQRSKVEFVDESAQKATSATKEDAVEVKQDLYKLSRRESRIETIEKDEPQKAKVLTKEEAVTVEGEAKKSGRKSSKIEITEPEPQKGKKEVEEEIDEDVDDLLRRAKKQRSLIEEIKVQEDKIEGPEALPVIIDSTMKDKSQYESLNVVYTVKGKANPPPTATWTLNGVPITTSTPRCSISQKGEEFKLEVKKLKMEDGGVYQCVLTNPVGDAKDQAKLDIIPQKEFRRPKVKDGLQDQTIQKKNTVTLKAVIIGDPVPDATWYLDGKAITEEEFEKYKIILETEDRELADDLKECTYSLTIPRCERSNEGKYTIKAKNKWGETESSAQLTIFLKPEIKGPEDVKVVPGNATELVCIVEAKPLPTVIWTRNENLVEAGDDIEIIEDVSAEKYILRFKNVKLGDEGYYKVTAKNEFGQDSSEGRVRVIKEPEPTTEKPKFITTLADAHIEHGGEITLMVRADGLPRPQITWFLNNKPIENAPELKTVENTESQVTSYLTIPDFNEKDSGYYKVTAVNVVGDAETSAKISMIQTPPSFSLRLIRNMDINEGEPLVLKAKITGSPKPALKWYKDGEEVPADSDRIKTEFTKDGNVKLQIDEVKPSDSGAYKLIAKNQNGETAGLCAVAVTPTPQRPKFTKCLKDQKLTLGEPLRLEAYVTAYPPPEIKWFKDGLPVRPSSNVHLEHHPDGKIALVIDAVKPEHAGKYSVIATNKHGDITGEANVTTERRPTRPDFSERLFPQNVVEGFPVKMEVKVTGFPTPTVTWFRNDAEVIPDPQHIKITNLPDGTSVLVIDACDKNVDALTYKAVASNEAGTAESTAPLTVAPASKDNIPEERPMFLHPLRDVITDEDQELKIEVPFTGNPIPTVDWSKDGEPVRPSDRVLLTCDGRKVGLLIDKARPSDAGHYSVTINNPLGKDTTDAKAIVHKVYAPPKFTQRFTDLQQLPSRDAKFLARVSGVPQPEIKWYKDGQPLHETDKYRIKRDGDVCCLYVNNSGEADQGIYKAVATNKEGEDACEAKLEVVKEIKTPQKVEAPYFLKRLGDSELFKGMTAKFTACAAGIPEPDVVWFHNDEKLYPSERIRMEKDTAGLLRLTIAGIDQDDLGKYSCKVFNDYGQDICDAQLRFDETETKPKRPIVDQYTDYDKYKKSGAPLPLSDAPIISRMSDRRCTLSWKPSISPTPRAPVTYQLEMLEMPNGDWFTARSGIRGCVCDVGNLEPFRDYKFRIRVENKYGISDPSPHATTHRQKLEPDIPKWVPHLPPGVDFRPETSSYFPHDFDIDRPPHGGMAQAPRFLRREQDTSYGIKDQNTNLFWFVYGYPKPKMTFYFNDEPVESGGRFSTSYTRNGQATLFINKMLERDVGWYEAVASNEHGEARQRVRLELAESPIFLTRPDIEYVMVRGKARFQARIIGIPYPEVKWYRDWKPLATTSRTKIQFMEPDTHILVINDAILKDEGLYSVSARNVAGSASASAMLHIEENDLEFNVKTYNNLAPIKTRRQPLDSGYDLGDELGRGTQGITYHAVERINGRNYAAKVMHGRGDLRPFMYNELDILNQLRHKKLISLHDAYETDDTLALILELGGGGELVKDYLLKQDYYTETDIAGYIRQTLWGLKYMHEKGIGHLGLNIGDLLLAHPGSDDLKITDFSLSRRISMGRLFPLKYGVPEYVSPECAKGEGVGLGHDMWSVGIITYILLSGMSPFRGERDRETLYRIQEGKWSFDESWWKNISFEARDFISKLLIYQAEGRMDVHAALRHPWLERADKIRTDDFPISSKFLRDYFVLYREWYDNASCRNWFRRRPLEGAFTHPSRMVYPPNERYTPPPTIPTADRTPRKLPTWEDQLPTRSPLNYEIGIIKSESHYQCGPDTYLLQLRDVDFPVRIREYMKVAANRGPGAGYIVSDENGFDWSTPVIRERRRFTDIMDEEIDDERKARITKYGAGDTGYSIRRLRHEIGARLDAYAEAEAFLESKHEGRLPFFREKPQMVALQEGKDLELTCFAVGDPTPIVQWFKNDAIIAESHRIKIETDEEGRSHIKFAPALNFDIGLYKVVARNKIGQTVVRTRIVMGLVPDEPDSPEATQTSSTEALLTWKQPKFDGHSPVQCYSLQYKKANETEWTEQANNIDHEFYLMTGLEPSQSYVFRLCAKNSIGWSDPGVASMVVVTKPPGSPKIQLSKAMAHLQQITDSGQEPQAYAYSRPNYKLEVDPIDWTEANPQDHYEYISEISRGRFSAVVKAIDKRSDAIVVAKLLEQGENKDQVDGEFAALRSLRHERVAGLIAAYRTADSSVATFILEKLQGADVLTYLSSRHEYTEQTVATIVTQVLDALQYLHWRGLCHLDLQPDNIVMSGVRSVQVKLSDFGCAHRVTKLGNRVPIVGHSDYMAPEIIAEEPAFPLTDIWSLGVLMYVMLSGTLPFRGEDETESRQNILFVRYRFENLFQEVTQEGVRFLMLVFKRHPNKRPTAEECHENRWLLPTDFMIKKRERAVFLGNRLKEYNEQYHAEKRETTQNGTMTNGLTTGMLRSYSITEELMTAA